MNHPQGPVPVPIPASKATAGLARAAGAGAARTVPNLPGALTRQLSARLNIDATTAMRIALLYGDIEWLAGGKGVVAYSARDYARRHGLSRNTVLADLRRLLGLGALTASYDSGNGASYRLHGLPWPPREQGEANDRADPALLAGSAAGPALAQPLRHPGPLASPSPGSVDPPALAQPLRQGWLKASATIENSSKKKTKKEKKRDSAEGSDSKAEGVAAPDGAAPTALLDQLLELFRQRRPAEWPAPQRLTLSAERRSKLRRALAYAGGAGALERHLRSALAQVPPWYRQTYPQRPDGSRRPAHQFVDLLFRAPASERDCGVEAWHLFSWSEADAAAAPEPPASDGADALERARRLFRWECFQWRCQGVAALRLSLAERRELTGLLETAGEGIPGTGAEQFADPEPASEAGAALAP